LGFVPTPFQNALQGSRPSIEDLFGSPQHFWSYFVKALSFFRPVHEHVLMCSALLLSATLPVMAQDREGPRDQGWYVGYGLGAGQYGFRAGDFSKSAVGRLLGSAGDTVVSANESGGASKLYGGYNLNRLFGIEAALATVGATEIAYRNKATGKNAAKTDYSVSALTLAGVARHEFDSGFVVMGKAGVAFTAALSDYVIAQDGTLRTDDPVSGETNFYWGLSAGYKFTPRWALMLDYDNFGTAGDAKQTGRAKVQTLMASVQYRF